MSCHPDVRNEACRWALAVWLVGRIKLSETLSGSLVASADVAPGCDVAGVGGSMQCDRHGNIAGHLQPTLLLFSAVDMERGDRNRDGARAGYCVDASTRASACPLTPAIRPKFTRLDTRNGPIKHSILA